MAIEIVETKAIEQVSDSLYKGVPGIIDNARQEVVVYVNKHSRNSYVLVFLGLSGYYSEEELEDAIAKQLEAFLSPHNRCPSASHYRLLYHQLLLLTYIIFYDYNLYRGSLISWYIRNDSHFTARIISFLYHLNLNGDAFLQLFHMADNSHMSARFGMQ